MSVTQKRVSYNASFKLSVINYAKEHGNRAAERHFGPPPTEKMIREWRRQEEPLKLLNKDRKTFRTHRVKWPQLEEAMKLWAMNEQSMGKTICTKTLSLMASRWAKANGIKGFQGSSSWCLRFLKTHGMLPEWFKCKRAEDKLVVDKSDSAKTHEDKLNVGHYKELESGPELTTIQKSEDGGELETKFDIADLVNIDHEFTSGDPLAEKTGEDDHHDFEENSRNTIPSAENAMSQQQNKTVISTVTKNSGGIVRKRAPAAISTNPKRTKIDKLHSASKDALDLFFDGIKSTMRQFSATDIHQVKAKIFSIVSEVEAKYLDVPEMQTADDFELVKVKEELSDYHVQFCDEEEEERNSSVMEERMIKKEVNNIVSNDPLYMGESSGSGKGKVEEDASNKKVVRKTAFCPVWNCCEDNCSVRFSTERQLQMNTEFQNFTSEEKDAYICSLVLVIGDDCKIERTRVYRLPDSFDGSNVDVCKKMFRSVLNLTNKSITNALSKKSWGEYEFHDTLLAEARARQIVLNRKFQI